MIGGKKEQVAPSPTIFGNFNLQAQLPNGRSIAISGYVFEKESVESLNDRLDQMQECIERQRARCEIPELEAKLELLDKQMRDYLDHLEGIEQKSKTAGQTLSSQERMTLGQRKVNMERFKKELTKGEEAIVTAKRKAGLGA